MNALPGRMLVDVGAAEAVRARALWKLCADIAAAYYPRHDERAAATARQLAFTAWHLSERASQRTSPDGPARSLFGLEPEPIKQVTRSLLHDVYRHDLQRFLRITGLSRQALVKLPVESLLEAAAGGDLLAAALAAEVYRLGGPLSQRDDTRRCAETWFARYCTLRGPARHRVQSLRIRNFALDAEQLLRLVS